MHRFLIAFGLSSLILTATPASAATIIFDACDVSTLCNHLQLTSTLNGSAIDVTVSGLGGVYGIFGDSGGNHAFGININGTGVSLSNISPGFAFGGVNDTVNGFGFFEYLIDGPHTASGATLPLSFTVSRSGGFNSDMQLFETNALNYIASAHLRDNTTGNAGYVAARIPTNNTPVPEPGTMALVASGLAGAYLKRRRSMSAS